MNLIYRLHDPALPYLRLDVRREVTHVLVTIMEAMWIAPWFTALLPAARTLPPYTLLLYVAANALIALLVVRILDSRGMWENLRQFLFLLLLAFAILLAVGVVMPPTESQTVVREINPNDVLIKQLTLPPIVGMMILVSIVWWRGLRLAVVSPTPTRVAFGMRLGILLYFAVALSPQAQRVALASLSPFFFFGLLAISLARAIALREAGGQMVTFGSQWTLFMVLAAGGITLIGFLIAAWLGGMDSAALSQVVQPVFAAVVMLFTLLMTPVLLVVSTVVEAIMKVLLSGGIMNEVQLPSPEGEMALGQAQDTRLQGLLNEVQRFLDRIGGLQTCISVFVIVIIVLVIVLTIRQRQRAAIGDNEEREDLEGDALGSLLGLFRRGVGALNHALNTVGQFGLGRNLFAALTIRRSYARMVKLGEARGYPRAVSETPYEYRAVLQKAFPNAGQEVDLITEAYVGVHYGEVPESTEALQAVVQALERLKATAQGQP